MAGARNFLFGPANDDVALARLLETTARVTGFMKGAPGGPLPGWYLPGADNSVFLTDMMQQLAATYPDAAKPYYQTRMWTSLVWQPAYVAVIAVHVLGVLPDLSKISQATARGRDISGFRLPAGPQQTGDVETLIARAGADLRATCDGILADINAVGRLKPLPARRLLADRMLGLMVRLQEFVPGIAIEEQLRFCGLWLDAMGLAGEGSLDRITLEDARELLIMRRKGCCLDYLAMPGIYCISCPRQDDALRLSRQITTATAELDARSA